MIDRPDIAFDEPRHRYLLDGEPVPGVSTIAKVCAKPDPLLYWAWNLGRQGLDYRRELGRAADRGTAVHDALERLAQEDRIPRPDDYPAEEAGHVRSLLAWFLHYRPEFEAVEVVVGSRQHRYAGRYDIRCRIATEQLPGVAGDEFGGVLCLVDLKTSKDIYPSEHFAQLAGYELASAEMGFAPTDAQYALRTSPNGTFDPSIDARQFMCSTAEPGDFLAYLDAYRRRERIAAQDPREVAKRARAELRAIKAAAARDLEDVLEANLPGTVQELAAAVGVPVEEASKRLQAMRKRGAAVCVGRRWEVAISTNRKGT